MTSTEYFDKYRFEADPVLLHDIAVAMAPLVPAGIDALAGLELGGVPLATMLSQVTGLPARFVRKEAKTYGTCQLAEGGDLDGARLCIVEDVVTSGGAMLDAARRAPRARGAVLGTVVCVIDRESGGADQLAAADLELHALFTMTQLRPELTSTLQSSRIDGEALALGLLGMSWAFSRCSPKRRSIARTTHAACRLTEPGVDEVAARRSRVVTGVRAAVPSPTRSTAAAATAGRIFTARKIR